MPHHARRLGVLGELVDVAEQHHVIVHDNDLVRVRVRFRAGVRVRVRVRVRVTLTLTLTFSNCVSESAAMREKEKWWKRLDHEGGATNGSETMPTPSLCRCASAEWLRRPPTATYSGIRVCTRRADSTNQRMRLNSLR